MKVAIVYIFPENGGNGHLEKAIKFCATYHYNAAGHLHDTVIICNGCRCTEEARYLFESMPNCQFLEHDDSGFDIGGFQLAAKRVPCDMMVFLGGNSYIRRPGWLARMVQVYQEYGSDGLFGCTGNQGDTRFNVFPHVRTTGFWCNPALVNAHPLRVTHNGLRYEFEHGRTGLTTWALSQGKGVWVAGWNCVYDVHNCDAMPGGFHNANQENILVGDRLTAPPYYHCE